MNIAIIFAGGTGKRMTNSTIPKQFLEYNNKPILIYTLEHFQNNINIDSIILVCIENYLDKCKELCDKFEISKVQYIVPGGATTQESIFNGLKCANEHYGDNSIVLIHDGVRPIITDTLINELIDCTIRNSNAIPITEANDTIAINSHDGKLGNIVERSSCAHAKAPQCFFLKDIYEIHIKSKKENKNFIDCASMMQYYGYDLFTIPCSTDNIKITTPIDFLIFKGLIDDYDK